MVEIKTQQQIDTMKEAGKILAACHREIAKIIRPGITTWEIDQLAEEYIAAHGAKAEQKGYRGYTYATCASLNSEVCHGFPRKTPLAEGDIVTIDMVVNLQGWLADSAWTYAVGKISPEAERLLQVTGECLERGIRAAQIGSRIGDISHAIQSYAEAQGMSVVRAFTGHGIGRVIHEDLTIPHFGPAGRGLRLQEGMVFTIEPMINLGTYEVKIDKNGWTARTADGRLSAQYEHTIAIGKEGPVVLTGQ